LDSKEPFNYWVINGTTDDIRPYRLLYKRVWYIIDIIEIIWLEFK
jgi:hypothetical protein